MNNLKDRIWLFLINFFSPTCHQKASRSFFIGKYQLPICARCTGLLIGYIIGVILILLDIKIPAFISIILISIMFMDWFLQFKKIKMSTNYRRLGTGLLCGIGIIGVLANIFYYVFSMI